MASAREASAQVFLDDGFTDISPTDSPLPYSLLFRHISGPTSGPSPVEGCPTQVHYVGRLFPFAIQTSTPSSSFSNSDEDQQTMKQNNTAIAENEEEDVELIFESTRDIVKGRSVGGADMPVEIQLLRPDVTYSNSQPEPGIDRTLERPPGIAWDLALARMHQGQVCEIIVLNPELAYGIDGRPPKVLPNSPVKFELELVSWSDALPRFPRPDEIAASKLEREEEDRLRMEENPPPTVNERLADSDKARLVGNEAFKSGDFAKAKKQYDTAFVHLYYSTEEWDTLSQEEQDNMRQVKRVLHLNRALVKLSLGMDEEALWDCNQTLEICPNDIKALYRRAKVRMALLKKELEKEERGEFWIVERGKTLMSDAKADLFQCESEAKSQQKAKQKSDTKSSDAGDGGIGDVSTGGGGNVSTGPLTSNSTSSVNVRKDMENENSKKNEQQSSRSLSSLTDPACVKLGRELRTLEVQLRVCEKSYLEQQKELFRDRMFAGLKNINKKTDDAAKVGMEEEQRRLEEAALDDLPELDD